MTWNLTLAAVCTLLWGGGDAGGGVRMTLTWPVGEGQLLRAPLVPSGRCMSGSGLLSTAWKPFLIFKNQL